MTTEQAFKDLTQRRAWYKECKAHPETARRYKQLFNKGKLSEAKITKLLLAAGYKHTPSQWKR